MWNDIDHVCAIMLSVLLKANTAGAIAVYQRLRRSTAREEALVAAANVTLKESQERHLFVAVLNVVLQAEAERNALAHGHFGHSRIAEDALLWASSEAHIQHFLDWENGSYGDLTKELFYYRLQDLEAVFEQLKLAQHIVFRFNTYLRRPELPSLRETREEIYDQLSSLPPIREALRVLQANAAKGDPLSLRARR